MRLLRTLRTTQIDRSLTVGIVFEALLLTALVIIAWNDPGVLPWIH